MAVDRSGDLPAGDDVVDDAVELVADWLRAASSGEHGGERRAAARLARLIGDDAGVRFAMRFVDRVARHRHDRLAAQQLVRLTAGGSLPRFLGRLDRGLVRIGAALAPTLPWLVMPLARRRLRQLVGHLIVDPSPRSLRRHLAARRSEGYSLNVNLLGEAVLGEEEAERRRSRTIDLINRSDVGYVSVKLSSIASQIDLWAYDDELERLSERLRQLFLHSASSSPPTFVNLDMEEYRDLALTLDAFTTVLGEPALEALDAGIVLQAYLPDSFGALQRLVEWANERHRRAGGEIKIRLVKGANLAMERVDAVVHGWNQAPYETKAEVDANYKRCIDWLLTAERTRGVRVGIGSHNLFDVAWAHLLAARRGVADRVELEMLQGMAPAQQRVVRSATGSLLLYTPIVAREDFDVAVSYLFRRLEENTAPENFMRHLLTIRPGTAEFDTQAERFRAAVAQREQVGSRPRRAELPATPLGEFANQPGSDPTLESARAWIRSLRSRPAPPASTPVTSDPEIVDRMIATARAAQPDWWGLGAGKRRRVLRRVAAELESRRGDLLVAMAHEARKVFAEADPEVSEAVDFARWYAQSGLELERLEGVEFSPLGVVAVAPPWNFPVAIPAGGVLAALAAGNGVVLKPAPETPRCARIVADACWAGGIPRDLLQFAHLDDGPAARRLIESVDGVILTGSVDTARRFKRWRPDLVLLGETSGKNAMVVTPEADLELAASDLVRSAFSHAGQKCSVASLGILVGPVHHDTRFRRQLVDAARSLRVGPATEAKTALGPTIVPVEGKLARALQTLDRGETWLLRPEPRDDEGSLWTPGIKDGVTPGSFFHRTECFGPVLGIMRADDLDEAIEIQNGTAYGLTGGLHSLDDAEIDHWLERVEVGNAYVNRVTTGAIVGRQPFGGWKASSVGPSAKAGGPDYLLSLGAWTPTRSVRRDALDDADESDRWWWRHHYAVAHDPAALFCETNVLRYRVRPDVIIRVAAHSPPVEVERVIRAARRAGAHARVSVADERSIPDGRVAMVESEAAFRTRLGSIPHGRIRAVGAVDDETRVEAVAAGIDVAEAPVTVNGRLELRWFLRDQVVSRTVHRFGNLVGATPPASSAGA